MSTSISSSTTNALLHGRKIFAMETPIPDPLQCPRCNSSNTKFCYYNNYSLSQPRHFCKACKRYWTRGGTLRNVPVGGGCRRNKKFRRHPPPPKSSTVQPDVDLSSPSLPSSSSTPINNPFFYGLQSGYPHELNFPFSETRVSSNSTRLDPGLGFEQGIRDHADCIGFGSSSSSMASLLASSLQHQSLTPYEDMRMAVGNGGINSNQIIEQNNNTSFLWNSNNVGVWFDSSSSVPSLM